MFEKNKNEKLDIELFKNPTSEYRGAPFWAWNCKLEKDKLDRQIDYFKEMGFGGFHMHVRTGLDTPYLGEEFFECVDECLEKARENNMIAYLYDEDRYSSGAAGGEVTKNKEYRQRWLEITKNKRENVPNYKFDGKKATEDSLLCAFEIKFDKDFCIEEYKYYDVSEIKDQDLYYVYLMIAKDDPWYNNQAYINTFDEDAVEYFIKLTHERYKEHYSEEFGKMMPSIFTDEPQFRVKKALNFPDEECEVSMPWSDNFDTEFEKVYGIGLLKVLPEIFWNLSDNRVSVNRYHYHDFVAEMFARGFCDKVGKWCEENHIMLTGHMMEEPTLQSQTKSLGEAMRPLRNFQLPGIDTLCDCREFTTAKQAQSIAHQYGRAGIVSELDGVTGWDFDFRRHKLHGDWQAALGVVLRVPHLAWVSMAGEAKRDYPASISYQSAWYKDYHLVEDYFARVNTVLTRGKPDVKVGVIHPVESYWINWGPNSQTLEYRNMLDDRFSSLTSMLLHGFVDFDFISEALLPDLCKEAEFPMQVGSMSYETIIVPNCLTLRESTLKRLITFQKNGGKVIVTGVKPKYIDAIEAADKIEMLLSGAEYVEFDEYHLMNALKTGKFVDVRYADGRKMDKFIHQVRQDGDIKWVFFANTKKPETHDYTDCDLCRFYFEGDWNIELFEPMTGEVYGVDTVCKDGRTMFEKKMYAHDSLLIRASKEPVEKSLLADVELGKATLLGEKMAIELDEPNAFVLDMAEFKLDDGKLEPREEILRIDNLLRERLGYPSRMQESVQPYLIEDISKNNIVTLRYTVKSEIEVQARMALEKPEDAKLLVNGELVQIDVCGYYVDEDIKTFEIPMLKKGVNIIELEIPFGEKVDLERAYLLGDFGVRVEGAAAIITEPVRELAFGDYTVQGLPFYGGNVSYILDCKGAKTVQMNGFRGAAIRVETDDEVLGYIAFSPYVLEIPEKYRGEKLKFTLLGSRESAFGATHRFNQDRLNFWYSNFAWRTDGDSWSYEYQLPVKGIIKSPQIWR